MNLGGKKKIKGVEGRARIKSMKPPRTQSKKQRVEEGEKTKMRDIGNQHQKVRT